MSKGAQRYEGKAKRVYDTDDPSLYLVEYKDDATAFNGAKQGQIAGKGIINNRMSNALMRLLERHGVPTHYVEELSERTTLVRAVDIIPLEVIVRNRAAGSFSARYGVEEGRLFDRPTVEFSYKNDELGDPLLAECHAIALDLATEREIEVIKELALRIDSVLSDIWAACGVILVDFKLEFGRLHPSSDGTWAHPMQKGCAVPIVLADEISPDTSRLWDARSGKRLDKDRFRRDLGGVEKAYAEAMGRLEGALEDEGVFAGDVRDGAEGARR